MNIFYLSPDPRHAAQYHCDQHCSKMMIEYAQLMSAAHRMTESSHADNCYKLAHKNHPSTIWTRSSADHYSWLFELWRELSNEFYARRGKHHGSWTKLKDVLCYNPHLPLKGFTEPPQCMPEKYKVEGDAVTAYRNYYKYDKASFASWTWPNTSEPDWWTTNE
jgi:hypothetical protein